MQKRDGLCEWVRASHYSIGKCISGVIYHRLLSFLDFLSLTDRLSLCRSCLFCPSTFSTSIKTLLAMEIHHCACVRACARARLRKREWVCVCVCARARERERERETTFWATGGSVVVMLSIIERPCNPFLSMTRGTFSGRASCDSSSSIEQLCCCHWGRFFSSPRSITRWKN